MERRTRLRAAPRECVPLRRPAVAAQVKQEDKVRVVEEFTRDENVAVTVTTGLLRRPDVAFKAMSDDTVRFRRTATQ